MDKYQIAFISGTLAGILLDALDAASLVIQRAFGLRHILYLDYLAAMLLHGQPAQGVFEVVCAQFFHLMFTGAIGCVYIALLTLLKDKNSVFKGWLIAGVGIWFSAFMTGVLYRISLFVQAEMNSVLSDFITASIFGIALALIYEHLTRRYRARGES